MKCLLYRKYLMPYAEGTLTGRTERSVRRHVERCERCAREVADLKMTVGVLRGVEYPAMEPAFDIRSRVLSHITEAPAAPRPWWQGRAQMYAAAAAGTLLFGLVVVSQIPPPNASKSTSMSGSGYAEAGRSIGGGASGTIGSPRIKSGGAIHELPRAGSPSIGPGKPLDRGGRTAAGTEVLRGPGSAGSGAMDRRPELAVAPAPEPSANRVGPPDERSVAASRSVGAGAPTIHEQEMDRTGVSAKSAWEPEVRASRAMKTGEPDIAEGQTVTATPDSAGPVGETKASKSAFKASAPVHVSGPLDPRTGDQLLRSYEESKMYKELYAAATGLTRIDPKNPHWWYERGRAAELASMPKTAANCYQQVVSLKGTGVELDAAKARLRELESTRR